VTDFEPTEMGVKSQLPPPPLNEIGQEAPAPSLTVTEPVGVPPADGVTVTDTVVALPMVIGPVGTRLSIVVVVESGLVGCAATAVTKCPPLA
jgi:hypothetical protein